MTRQTLPRALEKKLYQEAGSMCPACGEANVKTLTVHHIVPYALTRQHDPASLIVLCSNCHAKAGRREITEDDLFAIKRRLAQGTAPNQRVPERASYTFYVGQQTASQITNIATDGPTTIKITKGRGRGVVVPPPQGAISEAQLREIDDQAARIAKESGGRTTVGFVKKRIKQMWSLTSVRHLPEQDYPEVLDYLRKFKWGQRGRVSPAAERGLLTRKAHAKAANVGWSHGKLSETCTKWYGRSFGNMSIHLLRDLVSRLEDVEAQSVSQATTRPPSSN